MADFKSKRREPGGQGYSASSWNPDWYYRAQSWSEGADVWDERTIELENDRQLARAKIPFQDKNPGIPSSQKNFQGHGYRR